MGRQIRIGFRWFAMIVLGAFAALIFWVVWSLVYPYHILTVKPGSWTIQNPGKRVKRGEQALVYVDYCVDKHDESPTLDIAIEQDGRHMLLKRQYPKPSDGCHTVTAPLATIPRVLPIESTTKAGSGKARLQFTVRYRINPVRTVEYVFLTDEFLIDP